MKNEHKNQRKWTRYRQLNQMLRQICFTAGKFPVDVERDLSSEVKKYSTQTFRHCRQVLTISQNQENKAALHRRRLSWVRVLSASGSSSSVLTSVRHAVQRLWSAFHCLSSIHPKLGTSLRDSRRRWPLRRDIQVPQQRGLLSWVSVYCCVLQWGPDAVSSQGDA